MKRMNGTFLLVALLVMVAGSARATILEEEYSPMNWRWSPQGGTAVELTASSEETYSGDAALKIVDGTKNAWIETDPNSWGTKDLSAEKSTYLELAIKPYDATYLSSFQFYIGEFNGAPANQKRQCWIIDDSYFDGTADANGWYVLHLELDDNGYATMDGSTINGNALIDDGQNTKAYYTVGNGAPDWTQIDMIRILFAGPTTETFYTQYVDTIALGQPVPEPTSLGVLGIGGLACILRRKRK